MAEIYPKNVSCLKISVVDKKRRLRRVDLLSEKKILEGLLYNYASTKEDYIINRMLANVNAELRILEESKKR